MTRIIGACRAADTPSGWADERLSKAYDLVEAVLADWNRDTEPHEGLCEALDAIEHADGDIVQFAPTPSKGPDHE